MFKSFARLGFGQRIQIFISMVSISVLVVAIGVVGLVFYGEFKRNLEDRVLQKSNLLADSVSAGVVFDQPESVSMMLSSLVVDDNIHSAVIYKKYGAADYRYFADYFATETEGSKQYQTGPSSQWVNNMYVLRLPILVDGEEVGRIIFREQDTYLTVFFYRIFMYMLPVLLVSSLLVWLIARVVQKRLSMPLRELTKAVNDVAYKQEYGKQVTIVSEDELGGLGKAFNHMLAKLAENDNFRAEKELEIIGLNSELEDKVFERTKELKDSIDNLKQTQEQLVEQEKMASLGSLVAGVAHEINTPIGVGITAVSHLRENTTSMKKAFDEGTLTKAGFGVNLGAIEECTDIVDGNLRRSADLVKAFKSVAVDQSSAEPRLFALQEYIQDILLSLRPKLKRTPHIIEVDIHGGIELYCHPGIFSQIITNLLMNSLNHAFLADQVGNIKISAHQDEAALRMEYTDDGQGIDAEILKNIFDPFVTTKRGQGGSGLGTHIIYNLVTQALGGHIQCLSERGKGVRFEISVPMENLTMRA